MANVDQEYINKMYDSSLASQKEALTQAYEQSATDLEAQQQKAQQQTDANLNRTYVEAAKAAKNYGEVQNAYGLSSGAMAQARLAQDNQLQSNLTTIRAQQQETDTEVERQRNLLAKEYASAISQAQADNDLARAQALYEQAKEAEAKLLQQQKEAASMLGAAGDFSMHSAAYGMSADQVAALQGEYERVMAQEQTAKEQAERQAMAQLLAGAGDFSGYNGLYGMTDNEVAKLQAAYDREIAAQKEAEEQKKQLAAAELMASVGDYSLLAQMYGLTAEQAARLTGGGSGSGGGDDYVYTPAPGRTPEDETQEGTTKTGGLSPEEIYEAARLRPWNQIIRKSGMPSR